MSGEEKAADKGAEEKQAAGADASKSCCDADGQKSTPPPSTEQTLKLGAEDLIKRRSRWQSSLAALRYVGSIASDDEVKLRESDRSTSLWLLIVCFFAFLSIVLPYMVPSDQAGLGSFVGWMTTQRVPLTLGADALIGALLLFYVANRFGIVTTLTPRQALLSWQLMLGSSLLGIFLTLNLALLCWVLAEHTHIVIPEAHSQAMGNSPAPGR